MNKEPRRLILCRTPVLLLLALPFLCVAVDLLWGTKIQHFPTFTSVNKTLDERVSIKFHLAQLVRGDDRKILEETGFGCDKTSHSIVCVSTKPVRINTLNMTVYVPDQPLDQTTVIRPYARQEGELKQISPVVVVQYTNNTAIQPPPPCEYNHHLPAVAFSSGSTGNVFHEMNEIIIPLFTTTRHFKSRVLFILEDYKPSFMAKYGNIISLLSDQEVMNPNANKSVHCFPGSIIGLKYHDNLALPENKGSSMSDFRQFLREAYNLQFTKVSQITKPRLMLLSRTGTRRFLNEDDMVRLMKELGFEVIVIRRSKVISNLSKFSRMINSCSVLVGAHGAGLTNEVFLPSGAVMVQVELLGTEWASKTYYGDTAKAMDVNYLRYKIRGEESSLSKLYGCNHSVVTDPGSVYRDRGYIEARSVYLDQQNVRVSLVRFRETLVEALSIVTDWEG